MKNDTTKLQKIDLVEEDLQRAQNTGLLGI